METGRGRAEAALVRVPTLDEIAAEPTLALELPAHATRQLTLRCVAVLAALASAEPAAPAASPAYDPDQLLSNADVARRIGASKSWVEHNLDALPPRVGVAGRPRWRASDIDRWLANRPRFGACESAGRTVRGASASATGAGGSATGSTANASSAQPTARRIRRR